ncbi:STAS domain-containing protein [Kitasatospora purpeofusca]|uniref:STAS domain-containing protein n=1 Tax=Kitasatospora purpeofusca TaxID=67352 RepID=UPI002A5A1A3F|nr:STAS domain-containing protein [Kitasatospora purpeofusca]MDY0810863.1 STAS domain-containing protein [Kitasatospora purpeofusca]
MAFGDVRAFPVPADLTASTPLASGGPLGEVHAGLGRLAVRLAPAAPHRIVARVRGEIDMDVAQDLREALVTALRASSTGLDLDLGAVTFCDCAGLNVLIDLRASAADADKSLVLTALSGPVGRLLRITGTDGDFTVAGGPEA